jgi:hypothetical protein
MKPHRVSSVEVYWPKSAKPSARGDITVRLIVAGAQVLPSEQTMSAAQADARAVFYVTPLAKGWLRNQKLEILSSGRKIQEIPMATKVVSQRLTWFLLFCTFFVPWFILNEITYGPMAEISQLPDGRKVHHRVAKEVERNIRANVPAPPAFLKDTQIESVLVDSPGYVAKGFQELVGVSGILPIAYFSAVAFLVLTILSALFHMPKRRTTSGKPIPLLAATETA